MTVKELIIELLDMPSEADVVTTHHTIEHMERPVELVTMKDYPMPYHKNGIVILHDEET